MANLWKRESNLGQREPVCKLMIQLPPDIRDKIIDLAVAQGVTPSEMVESMLLRAMGRDDTDLDRSLYG